MSFLSRLFGSSPAPVAPEAEAAPAPATVIIPDDLVALLTAGGADLGDAVETTLRKAIADLNKPGEGLPFWLVRDDKRSGEMEEALRDRVAQRRADEAKS